MRCEMFLLASPPVSLVSPNPPSTPSIKPASLTNVHSRSTSAASSAAAAAELCSRSSSLSQDSAIVNGEALMHANALLSSPVSVLPRDGLSHRDQVSQQSTTKWRPTFDRSSTSSASSSPATSSSQRLPPVDPDVFRAAQRQAIAALSVTPPGSPSSLTKPQIRRVKSDNPFTCYSHLSRTSPPTYGTLRRPSTQSGLGVRTDNSMVRRISEGNEAGDPVSHIHSVMASSGSVPMSRSPSSSPSSIAIGPQGLSYGEASDLGLDRPLLPSDTYRNVDDAILRLGWFWNSYAESIWGQPHPQMQFDPCLLRRPNEAPPIRNPPSVRLGTSLLAGKITSWDSAYGSIGIETLDAASWPAFLNAYAAGEVDLHTVANARNFCSGAMSAPLPPYEYARKVTICRLGLFSFGKSVIEKIDAVRTNFASAVGLPKEDVMPDLLFGEEGWEFHEKGFRHHNNLRRETVCAHVILNRNQGLTVDLRKDWRFRDSPYLKSINVVSGFPITSAAGLPLGGFCVVIKQEGRILDDRERALVRSAAEQISGILESNFAESFHLKMLRLSLAYEKVSTSFKEAKASRLPVLNYITGAVQLPGRQGLQLSGPVDNFSLDQTCQRIADALGLDAVFVAALIPDREDSSSLRQSMLGRYGLCPLDHSDARDYLPAFEQGSECTGCHVLQNTFRADWPLALPKPDDASNRGYGAAIVMSISVSRPAKRVLTDADDSAVLDPSQVHFVLLAATMSIRHVLGVEDMRFLQCLRPSLRVALSRCLDENSAAEVRTPPPTRTTAPSSPASVMPSMPSMPNIPSSPPRARAVSQSHLKQPQVRSSVSTGTSKQQQTKTTPTTSTALGRSGKKPSPSILTQIPIPPTPLVPDESSALPKKRAGTSRLQLLSNPLRLVQAASKKTTNAARAARDEFTSSRGSPTMQATATFGGGKSETSSTGSATKSSSKSRPGSGGGSARESSTKSSMYASGVSASSSVIASSSRADERRNAEAKSPKMTSSSSRTALAQSYEEQRSPIYSPISPSQGSSALAGLPRLSEHPMREEAASSAQVDRSRSTSVFSRPRFQDLTPTASAAPLAHKTSHSTGPQPPLRRPSVREAQRSPVSSFRSLALTPSSPTPSTISLAGSDSTVTRAPQRDNRRCSLTATSRSSSSRDLAPAESRKALEGSPGEALREISLGLDGPGAGAAEPSSGFVSLSTAPNSLAAQLAGQRNGPGGLGPSPRRTKPRDPERERDRSTPGSSLANPTRIFA